MPIPVSFDSQNSVKMNWVKLFSVRSDGSIGLHECDLNHFLLKITSKKVAVCSIIGESASGKTHLLEKLIAKFRYSSFSHEYFNAPSPHVEKSVWLWRLPKVYQTRDGDTLDLMFLDTFGLNDPASSSEILDSFLISLIGAVSSVLLYNVPKNVNFKNLDMLSESLFEFQYLIKNPQGTCKPRFVVRDCDTDEFMEATNKCVQYTWGDRIPITVLPDIREYPTSVTRLAKDVTDDLNGIDRLRSKDEIRSIFKNFVKDFNRNNATSQASSSSSLTRRFLNDISSPCRLASISSNSEMSRPDWVKLISVNPDDSIVLHTDVLDSFLKSIHSKKVAVCTMIGGCDNTRGQTNRLFTKLITKFQVSKYYNRSVLCSNLPAASTEKCVWLWRTPTFCRTPSFGNIELMFLDTTQFVLSDLETSESLDSFLVSLAGAVSSVLLYSVNGHVNRPHITMLNDYLFEFAPLTLNIYKPRFVVRDWKYFRIKTPDEIKKSMENMSDEVSRFTESTKRKKLSLLWDGRVPITFLPKNDEDMDMSLAIQRLGLDVIDDLSYDITRLRSKNKIRSIFKQSVKDFNRCHGDSLIKKSIETCVVESTTC